MADSLLESHHGVLMSIAGYGVFIIGPAGIGKSSLALELLLMLEILIQLLLFVLQGILVSTRQILSPLQLLWHLVWRQPLFFQQLF